MAGPCADIRDEASAAGVWLCRAELAGDAPGPAHGSAAERLSAHEAWELALAALRTHLAKAGARPVVCKTDGFGQLASSCLPSPEPSASPSLQPVASFPVSLTPTQQALLMLFPIPIGQTPIHPSKPLLPKAFSNQPPKTRPGPPSSQNPRHVWRIRSLPQAHPPCRPGQRPQTPRRRACLICECMSGPTKSPRLREGPSICPKALDPQHYAPEP